MLVKPQALLFAPVGLTALIVRVAGRFRDTAVEKRRATREAWMALAGIAVALIILWGVALPFSAQSGLSPIEWLWEKLFGATQGYRYMTVNTLNLYVILAQNWKRLEEAGAWPYVAWALFVLSYLYAIFLQALSKDGRKVFLSGAVLIVLVCTFGPMMHERYVYPAVILLLLAYADCRDRRLLWSALALTVTLFMNEALVLQGGMTELNYGHLDSSENWLNVSLSWSTS